MNSWLTSLFARSPFGPIQEHQHKVQECAEMVPQIIEACLRQDQELLRRLVKEVSRKENEAD